MQIFQWKAYEHFFIHKCDSNLREMLKQINNVRQHAQNRKYYISVEIVSGKRV